MKKLETTRTEIALLESKIKEQEDQYKLLQQEIEKNENILQGLSEEMIDETSGPRSRPTQMETIKAKLAEQQDLNKKLKRQLKEIEDQQVGRDFYFGNKKCNFIFAGGERKSNGNSESDSKVFEMQAGAVLICELRFC